MDRRRFIQSLTLPLAVPFVPLIGEAAGGLYVPAPEPLRDSCRFWVRRDPHHDREVLTMDAAVIWAAVGAKAAKCQALCGTALLPRGWTEADRQTREDNLLLELWSYWQDAHYPGWLHVVEFDHAQGVKRQQWRRVAFVQWVPPQRSPSAVIQDHGYALA